MSLRDITARFSCDGCGARFEGYIDPAWRTCEVLPSVFDLAEDAIRGFGPGSVQADMHLCAACTRVADAIGDEEYLPTRDEIVAALARADRPERAP
ncbi:hypothetical protein [Methylobrevis pamukkalensis]|uniref:Uncharacterized protein n=1 Tax=Methylobrevis pamukkalensis TaxID=1439726 RepID=A0A1E3H1L5_9HYPH|nr:hypothetical protein [Methylobrevis pamukkalensis]ODN70192.1 hypothetical protein A6302_02466 [Methylobrevis pamukkalensis]